MPARFRDIIRAAKKFGIRAEKPRSGSHWKLTGPDGKAYPIPSHGGDKSEIDDEYIRGLCRCFGLDEKEFRKKL